MFRNETLTVELFRGQEQITPKQLGKFLLVDSEYGVYSLVLTGQVAQTAKILFRLNGREKSPTEIVVSLAAGETRSVDLTLMEVGNLTVTVDGQELALAVFSPYRPPYEDDCPTICSWSM